MKTFCIGGIVFAGLNLLDLHYTLQHFEYEINPLVISNPALFYVLKLFTSGIILTICISKLKQGEQHGKSKNI